MVAVHRISGLRSSRVRGEGGERSGLLLLAEESPAAHERRLQHACCMPAGALLLLGCTVFAAADTHLYWSHLSMIVDSSSVAPAARSCSEETTGKQGKA